MKSRIILGLYFLLINIFILTGCNKNKDYGFKNDVNNLVASDTIVNDSTKIMTTDYKDTVNYLFYDSNISSKNLQVPIDNKIIGIKIINIKCFQDETFITDNVTTNDDIISGNTLAIELHDYVESFNKLFIETEKDNIEINVGQYYFEKVSEDTLDDIDKAKLVQYHTKEVINSFVGDFKLEGNLDKYDIEMKIPSRLQDLKIIQSTLIKNNDAYVYECSISDENFNKISLSHVYFDSILYQIDRVDHDSKYKLLVCSISLENQ